MGRTDGRRLVAESVAHRCVQLAWDRPPTNWECHGVVIINQSLPDTLGVVVAPRGRASISLLRALSVSVRACVFIIIITKHEDKDNRAVQCFAVVMVSYHFLSDGVLAALDAFTHLRVLPPDQKILHPSMVNGTSETRQDKTSIHVRGR